MWNIGIIGRIMFCVEYLRVLGNVDVYECSIVD